MFELKGKVALITGGARGIGLAVAKELLRNQVKGVALLDVEDEQGKLAIEELNKDFSKDCAIYIHADVAQRSQFEDAFEQTITLFNQLDVVINNAGTYQELQWEKCIGVNLQGCITGSLLAMDKYFPKTLGTSTGIILNVASVLGLWPMEYSPVYTATKYGIVGFSRALSGPNRCRNLKVNVLTICPGMTTTAIIIVKPGQIHEEFRQRLLDFVNNIFQPQTPEVLAHNAVKIIQNGETGSVWKLENSTSEEVKFPTLT